MSKNKDLEIRIDILTSALIYAINELKEFGSVEAVAELQEILEQG